jgi:DNA-directed RNA polymerase beta' subunit
MKLKKLSSEQRFDPTKVVTDYEIFDKRHKAADPDSPFPDDTRMFSDTGLFSKRIFGDADTAAEYSCECGKTVGKFYEGTVCPKCGSTVKYVESNIDKIGWVDISGAKYDSDGVVTDIGNGYKLVKYIPYMFLEKIIGRDNLKNIIHVPNSITINGELDADFLKESREQSPERKYWYIGATEFYEKYSEVLNYYNDLHKHPDQGIYDFLKDPDDVFTDKIPVMSILLRPAMRCDDGLQMDEINNIYIRIVKNANILNSKVEQLKIIKDSTLETIQAEYFALNEKILDEIRSKNGLIRNQICGTRINFSARNIISPAAPGIGIDEISIPYLTFIELYKFEIINIVRKIKNVSLKEAERIHYEATLKFDPEIHAICQEMVNSNEVGVLLNRNPTINIGSIYYLRVKEVKNNYTDFTMSINNCILPLLNADYDGDVLNLISIKDTEIREAMKAVFSPKRFLISPNDGRFNTSLSLARDQILGLNNLLM